MWWWSTALRHVGGSLLDDVAKSKSALQEDPPLKSATGASFSHEPSSRCRGTRVLAPARVCRAAGIGVVAGLAFISITNLGAQWNGDGEAGRFEGHA